MENKPTKGLKRNTVDKFYTKNAIVDLCLTFMKQTIQIEPTDLIIEPSAGNGAFINNIKTLSNHYVFYDLEPENAEIIKQDYLTMDYAAYKKQFPKIHVIGNPPFGRQSSSAIKFIKKSCEFCDSISFILPKSFKKDSLKKVVPLRFHLMFEVDLPEKSFLVEGIEHNVEAIFQVWEKKHTDRHVIEKLEPLYFIFVNKCNCHDISFRRVGVNAGAIDTNTDKKSVQSHYFIKFTNNKSVTDNIQSLQPLQFNHNNTVGPRSISKQELIQQFNQLL